MRSLIAVVGRVALWAAVAIVLIIGLARIVVVVAGGSKNSASAGTRVVERAPAWPDNAARDLAVQFTHDYWTRDPKHPGWYENTLGAHTTESLSSQVVPTWPRDTSLSVTALTVQNEKVLSGKKQRALITVSGTITQNDLAARTEYLTVPVAKDNVGGLVVFDFPSMSAGTLHGSDDGDTIEPLPSDEQAEVSGRLTRFFTEYLGGNTAALADFTLPGVHLEALSVPLTLRDVGGISLTAPLHGNVREVAVDVTAEKTVSKDNTITFPLRYRLRLERGALWYVASINQGGS